MGDITRPVARLAGWLRGEYRISPADALHLATALHYGATLFVTNDRRLMQLGLEIVVLVLDDYLD